MLTGLWPAPGGTQEYVLYFDRQRDVRLLVLPALFDEGNKLRRFTVEVMRRLDTGGVDCVLPDLPGMNESTVNMAEQSLHQWREATKAAVDHFSATLVLTIRAGALLDPQTAPSIHYAPLAGANLLRTLARAQAMALKEAGTPVSRDDLLETGQTEGVALAGYALGPAMVQQLLEAKPFAANEEIQQTDLRGAGLWLRAEPAHDADQADRLAALLLDRLT